MRTYFLLFFLLTFANESEASMIRLDFSGSVTAARGDSPLQVGDVIRFSLVLNLSEQSNPVPTGNQRVRFIQRGSEDLVLSTLPVISSLGEGPSLARQSVPGNDDWIDITNDLPVVGPTFGTQIIFRDQIIDLPNGGTNNNSVVISSIGDIDLLDHPSLTSVIAALNFFDIGANPELFANFQSSSRNADFETVFDYSGSIDSISATVVPLPASLWMLGAALLGFFQTRFRTKKQGWYRQ